MTDVDTGEILASNIYKNYHHKSYVSLSCAKDVSKAWFDSFLRGLDKLKNLSLTITIKDDDSKTNSLFPTAF